MQLISQDDFLIRIARVRVVFELGILLDGGGARPCTCRVTTLDDELRVDAVEDGAGVVVIHAVLEEVPAC